MSRLMFFVMFLLVSPLMSPISASAPRASRQMDPHRRQLMRAAALAPLTSGLVACATPRRPISYTDLGEDRAVRLARPAVAGGTRSGVIPDLALANRITWGAQASTLSAIRELGQARWLQEQLHPEGEEGLPAEVRTRIDAMPIHSRSLEELIADLADKRRAIEAAADDEARQQARMAQQQAMAELSRQAAARSWWRALYSQHQLASQLTWFWTNHFSVFEGKADLRAMVGDYEERAIRPRVLGRFRDLVKATARHPAMLRFLDNEQNAIHRVNENYARELMELHTLGVDGGYRQADVQELARVLTGVGIRRPGADAPTLRPVLAPFLVRDGLFEFNPNRHDFNLKVLLGRTLQRQGLAEVDEAIDLLCAQPATARHVSTRLARYFLGAEPSPGLVAMLSDSFQRSDGHISQVLRRLFESPEFADSLLTGAFKDPTHFVISSLRLAESATPIVNPRPVMSWIQRLGQPLFGRSTPDGYPLEAADWSSAAQLTARFDVARAIAGGPAILYSEEDPPGRPNAPPGLAAGAVWRAMAAGVAPDTQAALAKAANPREWNTLLLASPEWSRR